MGLGREWIDSIYVLNYVANRQIGRVGGKLVVMFIDLKAAFDSVDKGVLVETRSRVRVSGEIGEGFWTARGVRRRCPLSLLVFNILISDIEEKMRKVKWEEVRVGERRIYRVIQ